MKVLTVPRGSFCCLLSEATTIAKYLRRASGRATKGTPATGLSGYAAAEHSLPYLPKNA